MHAFLPHYLNSGSRTTSAHRLCALEGNFFNIRDPIGSRDYQFLTSLLKSHLIASPLSTLICHSFFSKRANPQKTKLDYITPLLKTKASLLNMACNPMHDTNLACLSSPISLPLAHCSPASSLSLILSFILVQLGLPANENPLP